MSTQMLFVYTGERESIDMSAIESFIDSLLDLDAGSTHSFGFNITVSPAFGAQLIASARPQVLSSQNLNEKTHISLSRDRKQQINASFLILSIFQTLLRTYSKKSSTTN